MEKFDDDRIIPTPVAEPGHGGGPFVQRIAYGIQENGWQIVLAKKRFDVMVRPTVDSNPGSLTGFCENASKILGITLDFFERKAHRVALVQEGLILDLSDDQKIKIASKLFRYPPTFAQDIPFEWQWRTASEVEREFGGATEITNTIITTIRQKDIR